MLDWYFLHASYSGNSAISQDYLDRYTRELSKPGFLRSGLQYFATTMQDTEFFNSTLRGDPWHNPSLFLGGGSDIASVSFLRISWGPVASNGSYDIVPKARHWLGMFSLSLSKVSADEIYRRREPHVDSKQDRFVLR